MLFAIYDAQNQRKEVNIDAGTLAEMQRAETPTVSRFVASQVGDTGNNPSVLAQLASQMGINGNTTLHEAQSGKGYIGPEGAQAATVAGDGSIVGRLLVQATLFEAVENHLRNDLSGYAHMVSNNAALNRSIPDLKWENPTLDFTRPANSRPQPVAQLSEPVRTLTLRTGHRSNSLMGDSIGIEWSDQVARDTTLDIISLSVKRMVEESAAAIAIYQLDSLYLGDQDYGIQDLPTAIGGATTSASLDAASTGGVLTQKAWMKWLFKDNLKRTIDTVITDIDTAVKIAQRQGRPLESNRPDNDTKRIDTLENIVNPFWPDSVNIIVTQSSRWPANTVVGFQKAYGYMHITSTALSYQAVEDYVIRRSSVMRIDQGSMVTRYLDDAWDILTIS